jgi:hypothetical protein
LTGRREGLQQPLRPLVIPEDRLPPVTGIHDMINHPRILDAELPSHETSLMSPGSVGAIRHYNLINPFTVRTLGLLGFYLVPLRRC